MRLRIHQRLHLLRMNETAYKARYHLAFGIRRSARYHSKRQAFFEAFDQASTFVLIILGSGVMAPIRAENIFWIGLAVASVSAMKLVIGFGRRASVHSQLVKDFMRLEKELSQDDSEETFRRVKGMKDDLDASEPPVLRVLDVICHNEINRALDITDPDEYAEITPFQRLASPFFSWRPHTLKKGSP